MASLQRQTDDYLEEKDLKLCCFSFLLSSSANTGYHRRNIECASFQLVWKVSRFMIAFFLGSPKAYILVTKSNMEKKKKKKATVTNQDCSMEGVCFFSACNNKSLETLCPPYFILKKTPLPFFFFYTTRIKNNFLTITVTTNFKKVNCFQIGNTRHGKKCLLFVKISGLSLVNSRHLITEALKGQDNPIQRESNNHNVTY